MQRSPFDPIDDAMIPTFRNRLRRKVRRIVEPTAVRLVAWCRSLEDRASVGEAKARASEVRLDQVETQARVAEDRLDRLEAASDALSHRAERSEWGREALVERFNELRAADVSLADSLAAMEPRIEAAYWGREALVERFNETDAGLRSAEDRLASVQRQIDEHVPLPLAFGLDSLAMGRRLAAIEDQLEALLTAREQAQAGPSRLTSFRPDDAARVAS